MKDDLVTAAFVLAFALVLGIPIFLIQMRGLRRDRGQPPAARRRRGWPFRRGRPGAPAAPEAGKPATPSDAERRIAELEAALRTERAVSAGLRENLDIARRIISLRERIDERAKTHDTATVVRYEGIVRPPELNRDAAE